VSFNGSGSSDPDGTIANYKWDLDGNGTFETDSGASATTTKSYATAGILTVRLQVTDNNGATGQATKTLTINNRAPVASFTASPNPATTGQTVSFNGSASSDPDGTIANYKWDLDGNGTFETDSGASTTTTKSYATAGILTVRLQVTDNSGATGQTTRTLTINNRPPVASFTATPNPVQAGQTVSFNGSASSDPDGTIANYKWDLDGNGSFETNTGTTKTASRVYSALGNVAVKLRVTDNIGATTDATVTVTIRFIAKVNFQPAAAPVPAGYAVDSGAAYSAAKGSGWIRESGLSSHTPLDMTPNTFDRNVVTDQRVDTLIFMQAKNGGLQKTPGAWEMAVPNGTYTVTLSVGDASQTDGTHRINVEGQNAIAGFKPTPTVRFASATKTVPVADGRLTIDATGGTNTKLNYLDIASN
jgi:YD repeat-containing protein